MTLFGEPDAPAAREPPPALTVAELAVLARQFRPHLERLQQRLIVVYRVTETLIGLGEGNLTMEHVRLVCRSDRLLSKMDERLHVMAFSAPGWVVAKVVKTPAGSVAHWRYQG